jgi:hypothetical protein
MECEDVMRRKSGVRDKNIWDELDKRATHYIEEFLSLLARMDAVCKQDSQLIVSSELWRNMAADEAIEK